MMVQRISAAELLVVERLIAEANATIDDIRATLGPGHEAERQVGYAQLWLEGFANAACWTVEEI
jgi:hypothetical protein